MKALSCAWLLLKDTVTGFIDDDALSRGASIAYYTLFSIAPVLLVVVADRRPGLRPRGAGGRHRRPAQHHDGHQTAEALQGMIESAAKPREGTWATVVGFVVLLIATSGVFGEVQSAMNAIWKAKPGRSTLTRLMRARLASLGLVATSGFLLMVSLAASAALAGLSTYLKFVFPGVQALLNVADVVLSAVLIAGMFAAIFKILPDVDIAWRDVAVGAIATTILFEGGKYAIAFYIGQSNVASSYGAAGALIVLLVWIYYSAQIFLLGAEFSRAYASATGAMPIRDGDVRVARSNGVGHVTALQGKGRAGHRRGKNIGRRSRSRWRATARRCWSTAASDRRRSTRWWARSRRPAARRRQRWATSPIRPSRRSSPGRPRRWAGSTSWSATPACAARPPSSTCRSRNGAEIMSVALDGAFLLGKAFVPQMVAKGKGGAVRRHVGRVDPCRHAQPLPCLGVQVGPRRA
jgi:membrane protein